MVKNGDVFKHEWGELGLMQAGSTAKNPLCGRPSIMVVIARATPFPSHPDERPFP